MAAAAKAKAGDKRNFLIFGILFITDTGLMFVFLNLSYSIARDIFLFLV